jgi:L-aspartate oxidase
MRKNAGIVRFDTDLNKAKDALVLLREELQNIIKIHLISAELYELYNMITIGSLIVQQSIDRKENCGGFVKIASK